MSTDIRYCLFKELLHNFRVKSEFVFNKFNCVRITRFLKALLYRFNGRYVCTDVFEVIVRLGEPLIVGKSNFEVSCAPNQEFDSEATVEVYESSNEPSHGQLWNLSSV
jgi:hypothetical protein